jgi:hypothetical protein
MKNSIVLKVILVISGLIGVVIGGAILLAPVAFHATSGIELGGNTSLLSEIRAPGGAILASGILILSGAFLSELTFTSIVLSTLLYLSYGLSRIISMVADGKPAETLIQATVLEIMIGLVCAFALVKYRKKRIAHSEMAKGTW